MRLMTQLLPTVLVAAIGCRDPSLAPTTGGGAHRSFDVLASAACPATATFTVTDEAGFRAALAAATPGDVIAVDGTIAITADDSIFTDDLTITCATPGSGLVATGNGVFDMLTIGAKGVVVDGLVLDGSQAGDSPFFAMNDGVTFFAQDVRFTNNTVTCTPVGLCVFFAGGLRPVVRDNSFQSPGAASGIQLQANGPDPTAAVLPFRIDGARIERNTIVATIRSGGGGEFGAFGAIRPFEADDVVIADNVVTGPWQRGISVTRLSGSRISGNQIQGALLDGFHTSAALFLPTRPVSGNLFVNNVVTGAGRAGAFVHFACTNQFLANNLQGNAGGLGVFFDELTGANVVVGPANAVVIDNGAFDCDRDGDTDPNILRGIAAGRGANPTTGASDPMPITRRGIVLQ
ncbi:MAG TPA: right-handed parallel beta-helix repeat-containing protein [Gemmatimonadales bacterium]|nr:right-handed parallel beta-helix repeat-containing protein [Gemmatimonadales bacterium]